MNKPHLWPRIEFFSSRGQEPGIFALFRNSVSLSPCLFKLYAEYIIQNAQVDEAQAEIMIAGRNINNLRYVEDMTLMAQSEEELKNHLMKVKEESETSGLNSTFRKWRSWHLVTSLHTNWWGNNGNSERLYFGALQNHYRRWLQPWN